MSLSNPPSPPSGTDNTGASNDITPRLKLAKILKDYKEEKVDYIRTSKSVEALIAQEANKARIEENEYWSGKAHIEIAMKGKPLLRLKYFDERIAQLTADKEQADDTITSTANS